jgi:hypothetical protein
MTTELRRTAPVGETGRLRSGTGVRLVSQVANRVTAEAVIEADYAEIVVGGSRPHVIRANRAQALRFYWPKRGAVVFFRSVNHPGTDANPFFEKVIGRWGDYLRANG